MAVEARQLSRVLEVLGIACERLHEHPVEGFERRPIGTRRQQAVALSLECLSWERSGRGPPGSLVTVWSTEWDNLLLDVRVS